MRGAWAERSAGIQLLMLVFLALLGAVIFTFLGAGVALLRTDLSFYALWQALSSPESEQALRAFRSIQGFSTIGTFLFPALAGAYLFAPRPAAFLGIGPLPAPLIILLPLLLALAYGLGAMSDLLYRFTEGIPWPENWGDIKAYLTGNQSQMNEQYRSLLRMDTGWDFLETLLVMALLPALGEELLFRGVIQPILIKKSNAITGILITSVAFALLHQQFLAFLSIFFLGAILGLLRYWTQSLWPSVIVHFMNNATIVVMVYFYDLSYGEVTESDSPVIQMILGLLFLGIGLALMRNLGSIAKIGK